MIKRCTVLAAGLLCLGTMPVLAQNKPYPQAVSYPNCIKPNNVTQAAMNSSVSSYYDYWKSQYLKNNLSALPGGYYVKGDVTGEADPYVALGSSEGQGYGMVIAVLMAGYDPNAHAIYDGLFKTARAFHSSINSNLMGWIVADNSGALGFYDSATDGDMDIAYSLILAHYQWGSNGTINYLNEAKKMINNGLKVSNVTTNNRLNLADWDTKSALNSRPSDWMFSHMRAFNQETNDATWLNVINNLYSVYTQFSNAYTPTTGLISDFIVKNPPQPAPRNFLEEFPETDEYNYNACRVPLRIVMDYALYGSSSALTITTKMVNWIKTKSGGNPTNIIDGYKLNGSNTGSNTEAVFVAPFVAASVTSSNNQAFLNSGWTYMKNAKSGYYSDSYNLLCQLFISGNWWKPEAGVPGNQAPTVSITSPANNASFTSPANVSITANAADNDGTVSKVEFFNGSSKLGEAVNAPYTFAWNNVVAGSYALTAKATDNGNAVTTSSVVNITVGGAPACIPATASSDDGNVPANVLDNNLSTRWSASGEQWIQLCLANSVTVTGVEIAFYSGNTRRAKFDIQLSTDGSSWTTASANLQSSGTSTALETFNITPATAKYVRIVGHGNNVNAWNSYTEVKVKTTTAAARMAANTITKEGGTNELNPMGIKVYPNPVLQTATITFQVKEAGFANLGVFNTAGKPVAQLINEQVPAGVRKTTFNAASIPAGIYILRLVHNGKVTTTKLVKE
jgi:endo-1,4-beta-D-glucanase Y